MTLFDQLTPEAEKLINENIRLVNANIKSWISREKKVESGMAKEILLAFTVAKRRVNPNQVNLTLNQARKRQIDYLIRQGYQMPQFRGVINHMIDEWSGTEMEKNLTPDTLFAKNNFVKYLEAARTKALEKANSQKQTTTGRKSSNEYSEFLRS